MQGVKRSIHKRTLSIYLGGVVLSLLAPLACTDSDNVPANGGSGAGGHAGQGDSGSGGSAGSAGEGGDSCASVEFVSPTDGAQLTDADDVAGPAGNTCDDGFQYDVKASTSAEDGTTATLFSGSNLLATTTVKAGVATFPRVQLSIGTDALKVQVGSNSCALAQATVTVACAGLPSCDITKPVITPTHPALNGVPVAQGGDRASADGTPYQ